jgi:glycerol kinase
MAQIDSGPAVDRFVTRHDRSTHPVAGAIDLGSTVVKAGVLDAEGRLTEVRGIAAPPLSGDGDVREGDGAAYAAIADRLLDWLRDELPEAGPLGIASQRSTFLLWDRRTLSPLVPMISWQDRRGAGWCARNAGLGQSVVHRTGLVLSAHYVGPKLATMLEADTAWARRFRAPGSVFGTLDSYVMARWAREAVHDTDETMAARTAMYDLELGDWSDTLLARYGVPREVLPRVCPTVGRRLPLRGGLVLEASLADQAAGAVTLFQQGAACAVVILGTGAFVMRPAADATERIPGYLAAPVLSRPGSPTTFVQEGPVNGAGTAVDRFGKGPTPLPAEDPTPDAFCLPDAAGLGAPFWRPEIGFTLSTRAEGLPPSDLRRVAIEGVLFRVRQVLDDLAVGGSHRVLLAGGLTRETAIPSGMAAVLKRPVHVLDSHEAVLIGASRLAAGLDPFASPPVTEVRPDREGAYLPAKYGRWRSWVERLLVKAG